MRPWRSSPAGRDRIGHKRCKKSDRILGKRAGPHFLGTVEPVSLACFCELSARGHGVRVTLDENLSGAGGHRVPEVTGSLLLGSKSVKLRPELCACPELAPVQSCTPHLAQAEKRPWTNRVLLVRGVAASASVSSCGRLNLAMSRPRRRGVFGALASQSVCSSSSCI